MSCCSQDGAGSSSNGKVGSGEKACCAPTETENEEGFKNNGTHGAVQVRLFTPAYFLLCLRTNVTLATAAQACPSLLKGKAYLVQELLGASSQFYTGQQPTTFRGT